jgi:hypothetical protein
LLAAGLDFQLSASYTFPLLSCRGFLLRPESVPGGVAADTARGRVAFQPWDGGRLDALVDGRGAVKEIRKGDRVYKPVTDPAARLACLAEFRLWTLWASEKFRPAPGEESPREEAAADLVRLGWPSLPFVVKRAKAASEKKRADWTEALAPALRRVVRLCDPASKTTSVEEALSWWEKKRSTFFPTTKGRACWNIQGKEVCDFTLPLAPGYTVSLSNFLPDSRTYRVSGPVKGGRLDIILGGHYRRPFFRDRIPDTEGPEDFRAGRTDEGVYWAEGKLAGRLFRFETPDPLERYIFLGIVRNQVD